MRALVSVSPGVIELQEKPILEVGPTDAMWHLRDLNKKEVPMGHNETKKHDHAHHGKQEHGAGCGHGESHGKKHSESHEAPSSSAEGRDEKAKQKVSEIKRTD